MFCIKCGAKVLNNSKFCAKCGTKIENHHEKDKKTNTEESHEVNVSNYKEPVAPKKKSHIGIIIAAIVFGLMFLGGLTVGIIFLIGVTSTDSVMDDVEQTENNYHVESLSTKQKVRLGSYEIEIPASAYYEEDNDSDTLIFEYNETIYEVGLMGASYNLVSAKKNQLLTSMNSKVSGLNLTEVYEREVDNKLLIEFKGTIGSNNLIVVYTSLEALPNNCLVVFAYSSYLPEQSVLDMSKSLADSFKITRVMDNEVSGYIDFSPINDAIEEIKE
jgi:hypothetical protein